MSPQEIEERYARGGNPLRGLAFYPLYALFFVWFTLPTLGFYFLLWMWAVVVTYGIPRAMELLGIREPIRPEFEDIGYLTVPWERVPIALKLEFAFWRIPLYMWHKARALSYAPASFLSGNSRAELITDEQIKTTVTGGWMVHHLTLDGEGDDARLIFDLAPYHNNAFLDHVKVSALSLECARDGSPLIITMVDGSEHRPDDVTWPLAKMHFWTAACGFGYQCVHSWVHFVLPDLAAIQTHNELPKDSVLGQLLRPHFQYTMRINQVRNDGMSIANGNSLRHRLTPWLSFPVESRGFALGNDANSSAFYFPDEPIRAEGWGEFMETWLAERRGTPLDRWEPPHYAKNDATPFHRSMAAYYDDILVFVREVWPEVERPLYDKWIGGIGKWLPEIALVKPQEAVALMIWQVSFLHSADHWTLAESRLRVCNTTFRAFDPSDAEHPGRVCTPWQVVRSRCTNDLFGVPHSHPFQPMRIADTRHGFKKPALLKAEEDFLKRLRATEQRLKAEGNHIVDLDSIFPSLSY